MLEFLDLVDNDSPLVGQVLKFASLRDVPANVAIRNRIGWEFYVPVDGLRQRCWIRTEIRNRNAERLGVSECRLKRDVNIIQELNNSI